MIPEELKELIALSLEDGMIGEKEKEIIFRKAKRLNVDRDLAKYGFTKEELEYIEEVKFCLEGNSTISKLQRKSLDNLKTKLHIDDARAAELENVAN